MEKQVLYSIGHGSRKAEDFLALLQEYGILYLADVRSKPYSRFHPQFNRNQLSELLKGHGIIYIFMGDELGGRPPDPACYTDGKVDYSLLSQTEAYAHGIERLKTALVKSLPTAIMCSERDPRICHRSRLIGKTLEEQGIDLMHIDEQGGLTDQKSLKDKNRDLFT